MPKRKAKKAHQVCEICDCRIPDGDESWRVHVEGIRHRRRYAQAKNRGQLQLSIFEDLPQTGAGTFCRDPVVQELQRRQQRRRLVVGSDGIDLDKLHRSMMLDLPHLCGLSTAYHLAASRLTSDAIQGQMPIAVQLLSSCAPQEGCEQPQDRCIVAERRMLDAPWYQRDELAILQMLGEEVPEQGPAPEAVPPAGTTGPIQEDRDWLVLPRLSPAAVAAVAAALPRSCTEVLTLRLALPCDTAGQAAAAAALCAVARALPSAPNLQRLQIRMETSMVELSQQIALSQPRAAKDKWGALLRERSHIWAFFMATLCSSLQFNTTLTDLTICCLHGLLRAEDVAAVQRQMIAAPMRIRTAVLMACHRRLGAASPLQLLPEGLLENILDRAAPRLGARLHLRAQELFPG